jgi:RecA/RadA recombinase
MAKKKQTKNDPSKQLQTLLSNWRPKDTEFYSSGLLGLDWLLGGGAPTGKLIEVHAEAGCGKTTVFLYYLRLLMDKWDIPTALLDIEKSVDEDFKDSLGLTKHEEATDEEGRPRFLHLRLSTFSEAFEAMKAAFANGYKFIVWDSMTMTVADAALDKDIEAEEGGLHARAQARILPLIKREAYNSEGTVFILNQMRTNMNGARPGSKNWGYGSKPAGGKAIEFAADVRINLQPVQSLQKDQNPPYGILLRATTTKNKLAPPFEWTPLPLHFGRGVHLTEHLRDLALKEGLIKGVNGWYEVPGTEEKVHGADALTAWTKANAAEVRAWLKGDSKELEAS